MVVDVLASEPSLDRSLGRSRLRVWLRPSLAISRIDGHFSGELAAELSTFIEPTIRRSTRFLGLHDWTDSPSFDVAVPARLVAWTVGLLPHIARIVIATQHPLLSMAVSTANLTLKRIEHVSTREAWMDVVRGETDAARAR